MIEGLSSWPSIRHRHITAPLLHEREQFLLHLSARGRCRVSMRMTAAYLLHIVRIMQLSEFRAVTVEEIEEAGKEWAAYTGPERRSHRAGITENFVRTAKQWFTFHGILEAAPIPHFLAQLDHFTHDLRTVHGLAPATISGYSKKAAIFLNWIAPTHPTLETVQLSDVLAYLATRREAGQANNFIATQCQALRSFFAYAEIMGWCVRGIPQGILSPRVARYRGPARGPAWRDVRRLLQTTGDAGQKEARTHAILMLLTIYGLRRIEVARLQLSDFDWRGETLTVHRAKRGGVQHYPIQFEVGEAVIRYLRERPRCACRHLFISIYPPYRPFGLSGLWKAVSDRMKEVGVEAAHSGPHALRHACATRLLSKGSSLQEIADFLGHRSLASVSIYARYDTRLLKKVSTFSLAGVR